MAQSDRLERLIARFAPMGVDAVLVSHALDVQYLAEYPINDTWLLVTSRTVACITDGRYIEEVRRHLSGFIPVEFHRSMLEGIALCCHDLGIRSLGIDERHITAAQYRDLKTRAGSKVKFKAVNGAVDLLRRVKSPAEIRLIRKALDLDLKAYRFIEPQLKPGVCERDILFALQDFLRTNRTAFAFDPIIASGPNAAYPHARVTDRQLRSKEPILIDLGMVYKGYNSDLTRMFFLGKMPASYRDVVGVVRSAQEAAFRVIRPGAKAKDVFAAAWDHLKQHGLAEYFKHSLGHGVGLAVHEAPRLSHISEDILEDNMVITVEPGVYFPGKYGVRLEEMVRVTPKGCEVLSANHDQ